MADKNSLMVSTVEGNSGLEGNNGGGEANEKQPQSDYEPKSAFHVRAF